ncbi:MAG: ABC-2 family transporter protein [Chloroflexota bacterium]
MMRLYFEVCKLTFRLQLTYRTATIASLITALFFGLLRAYVLLALFGTQDAVAGISIAGAITYSGLVQGLIAYLSIFGWNDLMNTVDSGEISTDLLRPTAFFNYWLAKDFGQSMAQLLMYAIPIMVIYAFLFDTVMPASFLQWLAFIISLLLSWLVIFSWHFLVNLAAFWTPNARGVSIFVYGFVSVLSGFAMPLRFYPDWFIQLAELTPFPMMLNVCVEIYLGIIPDQDLVWLIGQQVMWAFILILIGQIVLQVGLRRLVIQGG